MLKDLTNILNGVGLCGEERRADVEVVGGAIGCAIRVVGWRERRRRVLATRTRRQQGVEGGHSAEQGGDELRGMMGDK